MSKQEFSLFDLQKHIQNVLEEKLDHNYHLIAEIGSIQENTAGHAYLELIEKDKDSDRLKAKARANIWIYTYRMLKPYFQSVTGSNLSQGMKVSVSVKVLYHPVFGISLNITDIDPEFTLGDIEKKRLEVIRRLEEEGVIDMNKELDLPDVPQRVAVISSQTAAGYQDFMNQLLNNGFGFRFHTELFPAVVQGNECPNSLAAALEAVLDREDEFDLVVIVRGGGAKSDLACFDDYITAAHIAQFPLPVLTGIGHERDTSIADRVACMQLKTPTAVAEFLIDRLAATDDLLNESRSRMLKTIEDSLRKEHDRLELLSRRLKTSVSNLMLTGNTAFEYAETSLTKAAKQFIQRKKSSLENIKKTIRYAAEQKLKADIQKFELINYQLSTATRNYINHQNNLLYSAEYRINAYDPKNILKLGYSYTKKDGKPVKDASGLKKDDELTTFFYKGEIKSVVK